VESRDKAATPKESLAQSAAVAIWLPKRRNCWHASAFGTDPSQGSMAKRKE
jgi:hypothetical protein